MTKNLLGHFPPPFVQPPTPADVPAKKKFHHDDGDDDDNVEDEKEEERDGLVICVFWKRPLAFLAVGELPLQQSQL